MTRITDADFWLDQMFAARAHGLNGKWAMTGLRWKCDGADFT